MQMRACTARGRVSCTAMLGASACLALFLHGAAACWTNAVNVGTRPTTSELRRVTVPSGSDSCRCCAICSNTPDCKSFAPRDAECILYNTVGGFADFNRGTWGELFFMPNSSQSGEFCRVDSDCLTSGEACRGRVCTADQTVTCRDHRSVNPGLPDGRYYGFVAGRETIFHCLMQYGSNGYTMLLLGSSNGAWTVDNRQDYVQETAETADYPNTWTMFSALWAADFIRKSTGGNTYEVMVKATRAITQGTAAWQDDEYKTCSLEFGVSKADVSILTSAPRPAQPTVLEGDCFEIFQDKSVLSVPYFTEEGDKLYHMNVDPASDYAALIRSGGELGLAGAQYPIYHVEVYIRE